MGEGERERRDCEEGKGRVGVTRVKIRGGEIRGTVTIYSSKVPDLRSEAMGPFFWSFIIQ